MHRYVCMDPTQIHMDREKEKKTQGERSGMMLTNNT